MKIAKVIVDIPSKSIDHIFDYKVPAKFEQVLEPGMRVVVPFGPRKIMGFVISLSDHTNVPREKLKGIEDLMDLTPILTKELIQLGNWLSDTTLSLKIVTLQAMLPQILKAKYEKELWLLADEETINPIIAKLFAGRHVITIKDVEESGMSYAQIQKYIREGIIEVKYKVKSRETKKKVSWVEPVDMMKLMEAREDVPKHAVKQLSLLDYFIENPEPILLKKLEKQLKISRATIRSLQEKGIVKITEKESYRDPYEDRQFHRTSPLKLTEEQQQAIEPIWNTIHKKAHDVFLLHGVTGSGKTEIYLQSIQKVLEQGKEAIVLVPEIALTPQMVQRFKGRFGSKVAVMHSGLSAGEKYDEWRKIQRQEVQVVVGARSAIFAPFTNLGIIIIDEEHETSYKQDETPRYHARDVAIFRGKFHSCPVVLGSATPTLESFARGKKGVYTLLPLKKRMNNNEMPSVSIVDMRDELHAGNRSMFSAELQEKIVDRLNKKQQIVLFLNRRGYSTFVMCRECGHTAQCPHCDISLTYHRKQERLKCHYCNYEQFMPKNCPECQSESIRFFGTGTQKVEEALNETFPEARVIRMDVDTTRRKGAHERLLSQFAEGKGDILLGTQMIAKGLDFGNVTLVGVLAADSLLHIPDFRSAEKTFQLLTQVSGRAGRHELPGEVVVQTYTPNHYSVELAGQYDYEGFFQYEMRTRKTFHYPPYFYLALITLSHPNHPYVIQSAQRVVKMLRDEVDVKTIILGPTPSPLLRVKDRYRYQCMIKYKNDKNLHVTIKKILKSFEEEMLKNDLQIIVDFQPYQMM